MNSEQFKQWRKLYGQYPLSYNQKPLIMGVVNVTPDSFSDGGKYNEPQAAVKQAESMICQGADLIDIGGESSRPGALSISVAEELARVIPVIERIRAKSDICISVDTTKFEVMQCAIAAGATIINDISAFTNNESLAIAVASEASLCLMHMQGKPKTMQKKPRYQADVVDEINQFFQQRIEVFLAAGVKHENIMLDPGFGFGKSAQHNLRLIKNLAVFQQHKLPLMLGVSRKNTIGEILDKPINQRIIGGLAIALFAALQGLAIIRTHDVDETNQALIMLTAINKH